MPITSAILDAAARHPDCVAIAGDDGRLTYAELVADSRRVAAAVDALHRAHPVDAAPETRGIPITAVSVGSAFHTARIVAGLAGYRAVSAAIDPRWPLAHRVGVVLQTGIGVVVGEDPAFAAALRERGWHGAFVGLDALDRHGTAAPPTVRDADEAFLLLFSSGTTSDPKAFLKTRGQYRANVAVSSAHLEPLPGVQTLAPGPVSYSLTLYAVIECLATAGGVHLADAFHPLDAARTIRDEGITRVVAVPAVVQGLVDAARRDAAALAGLDLVVTGGAHLPASLRDGLAGVLPRTRLVNYYGAAEIGFIGDSRGGAHLDVYDGIEVRIRDDAGRDLPDGDLGTLWVRAAACSDGYLAGTSDAVLRGPDGWATVHDQARIVDGRLALAGRAGDIVATGGHKVSLADVERAFDGMAGAVCAIALPHETLGSVVALVVEGDAASKEALAGRARTALAPQFAPRRWYRVPRLPRTVGGKVRRGETAALVARGEAERL
ncbi:class I adenylate-forming enzyme family protein [Microbacterium gilvum]|uniref:AMP-binding protein n=1 Tax=Microbacterium gilvum TaxID=1336204 RepID=A0ABP9AVH2_9MICO